MYKYIKYFILMKENKNEDVSYFGFPIVIRENSPFTRNELVKYLEENKIGTRNVFSGNILRHPGYLKFSNKKQIFENADYIMNNAFWIGVYPGIDKKRLDYIKKTLTIFLDKFKWIF